MLCAVVTDFLHPSDSPQLFILVTVGQQLYSLDPPIALTVLLNRLTLHSRYSAFLYSHCHWVGRSPRAATPPPRTPQTSVLAWVGFLHVGPSCSHFIRTQPARGRVTANSGSPDSIERDPMTPVPTPSEVTVTVGSFWDGVAPVCTVLRWTGPSRRCYIASSSSSLSFSHSNFSCVCEYRSPRGQAVLDPLGGGVVWS